MYFMEGRKMLVSMWAVAFWLSNRRGTLSDFLYKSGQKNSVTHSNVVNEGSKRERTLQSSYRPTFTKFDRLRVAHIAPNVDRLKIVCRFLCELC